MTRAMSERGARRPKYSILLPTHNRADVLPFAIRSVLSQTITDFELLVVGDGCSDETGAVAQSFSDERIRWFDLPKAPHFGYANRNIALREAAGELVAFMAHDDLWLPDHLELLAACLARTGAEIAYSRPLWVISPGFLAPLAFNLNDPQTLSRFLERQYNSIPAGCVAHRRECFAKYGYWNEHLPSGGDLDMWSRIIEGGKRKNFVYVPEPTCLHFRANWRKEADVGQPQVRVWAALHSLGNFVPAELKLLAPPGATEQETFWRAIEKDPAGWPARLRAAVHSVLDRRVTLSDELIVRTIEAGVAYPFGPDELLRTYVRLDKIGQLAAEMESSAGWRLVRRTRRLLDKLAPRGTRRERIWLRAESALRRRL